MTPPDPFPVCGLYSGLIGTGSDSEYCVVILVLHDGESVMRAVDCRWIAIPWPGMPAESGSSRQQDELVSPTQ